MCYHLKFGISATKGVRINEKKPQNWGALGPRTLWAGNLADPRETSPSRYMLPRQIWLFCVNGMYA